MIGPEPARALAGLLDIDPPALGPGESLPPLWHWIYLMERHRQSELGDDGHPLDGIPAPPGPGRIRMFAGGRVTTHALLRFGEPATLTATVTATVQKNGRGGPLTFVTVQNEIAQRGVAAIVDEQDVVYRGQGHTLSTRTTEEVQPSAPSPHHRLVLEFDVDPIVLFRFSALTYNAHRIHYDQAYAAKEGYPDLVVHGPLQALLMSELIRRSGVSMSGRQFAYRLVAPAFGKQRLAIAADVRTLEIAVHVRDGRGRLTAMSTLLRPR